MNKNHEPIPNKELLELESFTGVEFGWDLRTFPYDKELGGPIFMANDVAAALGYKSPKDAIRDHCKHPVVRTAKFAAKNRYGKFERPADAVFIGESDVFRLITKSKLSTAERFSDWIFEDVLPSLKKQGHYLTDGTIGSLIDNPEALATLLACILQRVKERNELSALLAKAEKDKEFKDNVQRYYKGYCSIGDVATKMTTSNIINIGRNELFRILREMKVLQTQKWNAPYRRFLRSGKMTVYKHKLRSNNRIVGVPLVSESFVDELIQMVMDYLKSKTRNVSGLLQTESDDYDVYGDTADVYDDSESEDECVYLVETGELAKTALHWYLKKGLPIPVELIKEVLKMV